MYQKYKHYIQTALLICGKVLIEGETSHFCLVKFIVPTYLEESVSGWLQCKLLNTKSLNVRCGWGRGWEDMKITCLTCLSFRTNVGISTQHSIRLFIIYMSHVGVWEGGHTPFTFASTRLIVFKIADQPRYPVSLLLVQIQKGWNTLFTLGSRELWRAPVAVSKDTSIKKKCAANWEANAGNFIRDESWRAHC